MKRITYRSSVLILVRFFSYAVLIGLFLPSLLVADPCYYGIGLDSLTWSGEGVVDGQTYEDLNSDAGMAFLLGCRLNGYLSLELFGYQSSSVYLKESDTDYLGHSLIGLGPRINIQDIRRHRWTPWFALYATYQSIDRYRNYCCGESPEPIYTLMDGMGHSRAFGVDIKIAKNTLLQVAVRDSSVWAGWDDPDMEDGETSAEEIFIGINFSPEPAE